MARHGWMVRRRCLGWAAATCVLLALVLTGCREKQFDATAAVRPTATTLGILMLRDQVDPGPAQAAHITTARWAAPGSLLVLVEVGTCTGLKGTQAQGSPPVVTVSVADTTREHACGSEAVSRGVLVSLPPPG